MNSYIRCLWGNNEEGSRRQKIENDIKATQLLHPIDYTCYTYGLQNHNQLIDLGVKSILVSEEPLIFSKEQMYYHKIHAIGRALKDYEAVILLDFDTLATKQPPKDIWSKLAEGNPLRIPLRIYHNPKAQAWRKRNQRKIPCASWIYCRDIELPNKLLDILKNKLKGHWREELAFAYYTDKFLGGFDLEKYGQTFEPEYFYLSHGSMFEHPNHCFEHFNKEGIAKLLGGKV